ncbi:hypothetical protein IAU59_003944 [Kwoniella sp. CBS 9459]
MSYLDHVNPPAQEPSDLRVELMKNPQVTVTDLDNAFPLGGRHLDYSETVFGPHLTQLTQAYRREGAHPQAQSRAIALMTQRALQSDSFKSLKPMMLKAALSSWSGTGIEGEEYRRKMSQAWHLHPKDIDLSRQTMESQLEPSATGDMGEIAAISELSKKGQEIMELEAVDEVILRLHGVESTTALPQYPSELDATLSANAAHHTKSNWKLQQLQYDPSIPARYRSIAAFTKSCVLTGLYADDELWERRRELLPSSYTQVGSPSTAPPTSATISAGPSSAAGSGLGTVTPAVTAIVPDRSIATQSGTVSLNEAYDFARKHGLDPHQVFSVLDEKSGAVGVTDTAIGGAESTEPQSVRDGSMQYHPQSSEADRFDTGSRTGDGDKSWWDKCCK